MSFMGIKSSTSSEIITRAVKLSCNSTVTGVKTFRSCVLIRSVFVRIVLHCVLCSVVLHYTVFIVFYYEILKLHCIDILWYFCFEVYCVFIVSFVNRIYYVYCIVMNLDWIGLHYIALYCIPLDVLHCISLFTSSRILKFSTDNLL